jgi:hypothetical protein
VPAQVQQGKRAQAAVSFAKLLDKCVSQKIAPADEVGEGGWCVRGVRVPPSSPSPSSPSPSSPHARPPPLPLPSSR